jgi:hypothetical protein
VLPASPIPDGAATPRRAASRRLAWHAIGWIAAAVLAWLLLRAYRDPAMMLELANWRLC